MQDLLVSTFELDDIPGQYRTLTNETKLSLGFALAKHSGTALYRTAHLQLKRSLWGNGRKFLGKFLRHPVQSFHQTKDLLYWIRWIKYLFPLLRRVCKLRNHLLWMYCTLRQARERRLAEQRRKHAFRNLTARQQLDRAAQTIQSTYRSYRQRQDCIQMLLSRQELDDRAARRIQLCVRILLDRHHEKKQELKRLEERLKERTKRRTTLDDKERDRLEELCKQYNRYSIDRRLLMRPDTKFQFLWKSLFVGITILQIVGYGLNQKFQQQQRVSLSEKIEQWLLPESVLKRSECSCLAKARGDIVQWNKLRTSRKKCKTEPWYCTPDYLQRQTMHGKAVKWAMEGLLFLGSLAAFLDVPVFFYTGVYHPETGELVPKNFVRRWIFPGLLLQLLINPHMEPASKIFFKLMKSTFQIGPIRVLRWCRVLFYPLASWIFVFLETNVWMPLVSFTNRVPAVPPEAPPEKRRSSIDLKRVSLYLQPTPPKRASIFKSATGPYYHPHAPRRLSYDRISRSTSRATLHRSPRQISATKKVV